MSVIQNIIQNTITSPLQLAYTYKLFHNKLLIVQVFPSLHSFVTFIDICHFCGKLRTIICPSPVQHFRVIIFGSTRTCVYIPRTSISCFGPVQQFKLTFLCSNRACHCILGASIGPAPWSTSVLQADYCNKQQMIISLHLRDIHLSS